MIITQVLHMISQQGNYDFLKQQKVLKTKNELLLLCVALTPADSHACLEGAVYHQLPFLYNMRIS